MFRSTSCSNCLTIHFRHSWRNPLCIKWFDRLNGASTRSGDVIWPNCGRHQDDSKEYTQQHLWEEWGRKSSVSGFYSSDDLMALPRGIGYKMSTFSLLTTTVLTVMATEIEIEEKLLEARGLISDWLRSFGYTRLLLSFVCISSNSLSSREHCLVREK